MRWELAIRWASEPYRVSGTCALNPLLLHKIVANMPAESVIWNMLTAFDASRLNCRWKKSEFTKLNLQFYDHQATASQMVQSSFAKWLNGKFSLRNLLWLKSFWKSNVVRCCKKLIFHGWCWQIRSHFLQLFHDGFPPWLFQAAKWRRHENGGTRRQSC